MSSKHKIQVSEIAPDSTEKEGTGPLQNYIDRQCLIVDESDFVEKHFYSGNRPNLDDIRHLIIGLEDYIHAPIPDDRIIELLEKNIFY